ncbi:unnamed protein product [Rhodiola kirilowii]
MLHPQISHASTKKIELPSKALIIYPNRSREAVTPCSTLIASTSKHLSTACYRQRRLKPFGSEDREMTERFPPQPKSELGADGVGAEWLTAVTDKDGRELSHDFGTLRCQVRLRRGLGSSNRPHRRPSLRHERLLRNGEGVTLTQTWHQSAICDL